MVNSKMATVAVHLGYQNGMILSMLSRHMAQMPPNKFPFSHWTLDHRVQNIAGNR